MPIALLEKYFGKYVSWLLGMICYWEFYSKIQAQKYSISTI